MYTHELKWRLRILAINLCLWSQLASAQIVIGQSLPLTGGLSELGQDVLKGASLHFEQINASGGVAGQAIQIRTLDDAGKADKTAENVRTLIEGAKVVAIFGGVEGGPCTRSLKVAAELKTPFIACMAGSPEMREPFDPHVFTVRAPHFAEFEKIITLAASYGYTKFAFLHSDSDTGRKHLANVNRLLAARNLPNAQSLSMTSEKTDSALAKQLLASDAQVVFNHGSYDMYANIILQVRKVAPGKVTFFAVNSGIAQMARKLGDLGKGITFTSIVPFPNSGREAIAREFRKLFATKYPNETPSLSAMEGYISAKVLTEGLKRAGKNPTRQSLLRAMENLGTINLGNYSVHYAPNEHTGSTFVETAVIGAEGRFVH
jgi:branched-chain amino acid transport system substrate-binding protein